VFAQCSRSHVISWCWMPSALVRQLRHTHTHTHTHTLVYAHRNLCRAWSTVDRILPGGTTLLCGHHISSFRNKYSQWINHSFAPTCQSSCSYLVAFDSEGPFWRTTLAWHRQLSLHIQSYLNGEGWGFGQCARWKHQFQKLRLTPPQENEIIWPHEVLQE
jgi:hypothetical protein